MNKTKACLPLVSVIVPTRNSAKTIRTLLKSIREQTYRRVEIILIDNYSTDRTLEIAKDFTQKIFQKGPERSVQRNFGVKMSSGEFVAWFDSDMELGKGVLAESVAAFKKDKNLGGLIVPEKSFGQGFWANCRALEKRCYLGDDKIEAVRFTRKEIFNKIGKWSTKLISGEDWDFTTRMRQKKYRIGRIKSFVRHNEGQLKYFQILKKKFYYATKSLPYVDSHIKKPLDVILFLFRPAFLRNWRLFVADPIHGLGLLFLKMSEFGIGLAGIILARIKIIK